MKHHYSKFFILAKLTPIIVAPILFLTSCANDGSSSNVSDRLPQNSNFFKIDEIDGTKVYSGFSDEFINAASSTNSALEYINNLLDKNSVHYYLDLSHCIISGNQYAFSGGDDEDSILYHNTEIIYSCFDGIDLSYAIFSALNVPDKLGCYTGYQTFSGIMLDNAAIYDQFDMSTIKWLDLTSSEFQISSDKYEDILTGTSDVQTAYMTFANVNFSHLEKIYMNNAIANIEVCESLTTSTRQNVYFDTFSYTFYNDDMSRLKQLYLDNIDGSISDLTNSFVDDNSASSRCYTTLSSTFANSIFALLQQLSLFNINIGYYHIGDWGSAIRENNIIISIGYATFYADIFVKLISLNIDNVAFTNINIQYSINISDKILLYTAQDLFFNCSFPILANLDLKDGLFSVPSNIDVSMIYPAYQTFEYMSALSLKSINFGLLTTDYQEKWFSTDSFTNSIFSIQQKGKWLYSSNIPPSGYFWGFDNIAWNAWEWNMV